MTKPDLNVRDAVLYWVEADRSAGSVTHGPVGLNGRAPEWALAVARWCCAPSPTGGGVVGRVYGTSSQAMPGVWRGAVVARHEGHVCDLHAAAGRFLEEAK